MHCPLMKYSYFRVIIPSLTKDIQYYQYKLIQRFLVFFDFQKSRIVLEESSLKTMRFFIVWYFGTVALSTHLRTNEFLKWSQNLNMKSKTNKKQPPPPQNTQIQSIKKVYRLFTNYYSFAHWALAPSLSFMKCTVHHISERLLNE